MDGAETLQELRSTYLEQPLFPKRNRKRAVLNTNAHQFCWITTDITELNSMLQRSSDSVIQEIRILTDSIHTWNSPCVAIFTRCPSAISPFASAM